jgi:hypothetical protein
VALVDDIRKALRVTSEAFDGEIAMLVGAALYDMERAGVNPALLEEDDEGELENPFVKTAVYAYCKAHFGYDNPEASRFDDSYRRIVCDLMNSSENIAAIEREEPPEDGGE